LTEREVPLGNSGKVRVVFVVLVVLRRLTLGGTHPPPSGLESAAPGGTCPLPSGLESAALGGTCPPPSNFDATTLSS